jgi:hypothetical protein
MAGGFVWPYFPILLSVNGFSSTAIGLVLAISNLLVILVRLPLGRWLDQSHHFRSSLLLLPFPFALYFLSSSRSALLLVALITLLPLFRLPILPLVLSRVKSHSEAIRSSFTPFYFVGIQHFFLGILGLLAGAIMIPLGPERTLSWVWLVCLVGLLPLLFAPSPRGPGEHPENLPADRLALDRTTLLILGAFFAFHFVNAPLLPFAELYMKRHTVHPGWIPWIAAIAEIFMVVSAWGVSRSRSVRLARQGLVFASFFLALRLGFYGLSPTAPGFLWIACLDGIASGLFWTGSISWVAVRTGPGRTFNQLAGYLDLMVMTGGAGGTLLFGWASSRWGFDGSSLRFLPLSFLAPLLLLMAGKGAWSPNSRESVEDRRGRLP